MTQSHRTLIITVIALFLSFEGFSQGYLDDLAKQSCECLESIPQDMELNNLNMELGLCMLKAAKPYEKKLKKDHDINLSKIATEGQDVGERLGALIGVGMMAYCPDGMMAIVKMNQQNNEDMKVSDNTTTGNVNEITKDTFISFAIRTDNGITTKYYWLTPIETDLNLPFDYEKLINSNITVTYTEMEMYDDRIKEYRPFKVINSLKKLD